MHYDQIGLTYSSHRRVEPRLAAPLWEALGAARTVLNVGAGTGAYEPTDRHVVAVEPSAVMIAQRPACTAPAVLARCESLPFADRTFDAVLAALTVHHWNDLRRGLGECARVARDRVVLFTWDPASEGFWLVRDYFPDLLTIDRALFPSMDTLANALGAINVRPLPIPAACADGFLGAFWRRPAAYLDPAVRQGISSFLRIGNVEVRLKRLRDDLSSGAWQRRNGTLLAQDSFDLGYRLVVARRCNTLL
jgi:SAM-dependent methyltransferase